MAALKNDYQYQKAFELVKAGLESGSIKLHGPTTVNQSSMHGSADAKYLRALLEELAAALPGSD